MKTSLHFFVVLLLFIWVDSVSAQMFHPNRSYQARLDFERVADGNDDEIESSFLIHFNQGFHFKKGSSFLYDILMRGNVDVGEIEFILFYRKAYLRKEKIEAYLGMELGSRIFENYDNSNRDNTKFFLAVDAGYQFFLNKNTALEWNISYPFLRSEPKSDDETLGKYGLTSGRLNTSLRFRYFLKSRKNEIISPGTHRQKRGQWMLGGSLELGALNEFDEEGTPLVNILNPVIGIMASERWMFGSGIHISTANKPSDLIYFGVSPFARNYLAESNERMTAYWELWALLIDKAERPETTKDYALVDVGAGTGFGVGYWLSPHVNLNCSFGIRLLLDAEEYFDSEERKLNNIAYFKFGMESFL